MVDGAALSYANATAAPGPALYFFHGTYDEVLPPDASIQLKERADSRQQPSILRLAPADHVPISLISASYMQDMLWFIRRALRLDAGDTGAADDTGGNAPYVNSTSSSQACLLVDSPVTSHCVGPPTGDQQAAIGDVGLSWSDVISLPNGRKYKFYIPHVYQLRRKPLPVVLALHGGIWKIRILKLNNN